MFAFIQALFLRDFILSTLSIKESLWSSLSTATIDEHIRLCHLQALFVILKGDDPFLNQESMEELLSIDPRYKVALLPSQIETITESVRLHLDFYSSTLLPALRDFLVMLRSADHLRITDLIKDDLVASFFFDDRDALSAFPDDPSLTIDRSYSLYLLILKCLAI